VEWKKVVAVADAVITNIKNINRTPLALAFSFSLMKYLLQKLCIVLMILGFLFSDYHSFSVFANEEKHDLLRASNVLWGDVVWVSDIYPEDKIAFQFWGSELAFNYHESSLDTSEMLYNLNETSDQLKSWWEKLEAERMLDMAYISIAKRDISKYSSCAATNFKVGMKALSAWVLLKPGQVRNANQAFSYLEGYCTGESKQVYRFYQGICGVTSMVFRVSMLAPQLDITKRAGHTDRYTTYYGQQVVGDDAAIYEDIKQFEIQNTSTGDVVLKSLRVGSDPYVVLISQSPLQSPLLLQKQTLDALKAQIIRIYDSQKIVRSSAYNATIDTVN
jgi:hypothetical protein